MPRKKIDKDYKEPTYHLDAPIYPGGHYYITKNSDYDILEKKIQHTEPLKYMMIKKNEETLVRAFNDGRCDRARQRNLKIIYDTLFEDRKPTIDEPNSLKDNNWRD